MRLFLSCLLSVLFLSLVACSRRGGDDEGSWYENARERRSQRESFVAHQAEFGISEVEAKKAWDREEMIRKTVGHSDGVEFVPENLRP